MRSFLLTVLVGLFFVSVAFTFDQKRDCKCRSTVSKRIINGRIADQASYPWQISINMKDSFPLPDILRRLVPNRIKLEKHNCGGSIINERWILTAAHCVPPKKTGIQIENFFQIAYSSNDLVQMYDKKLYMEIEKAIVHPDFGAIKNDDGTERVVNDIALIKLKEPLRFSTKAQPACLGVERKEKYEGIMKMSGWGSVNAVLVNPVNGDSQDLEISRFLKEGDSDDGSDSLKICADAEQNICVDNKRTKDAACKGDSGGPLHYINNGKSTVVGIASFVDIEQTSGQMVRVCLGQTAYVRVSTFKEFIEKNVGDDYCV